MKKVIVTLALASTLIFTCVDTRPPIPIQDKVLVDKIRHKSKPIIKKSMTMAEKDSLYYEEMAAKPIEFFIDNALKRRNFLEAGILILVALDKQNCEKYTRKELHNMFWKEVIAGTESDMNWELKEYLIEEYRKDFPK